LKGNIAAGLLLFAGYENGSFLDPFCRDGIVAIEAALIATKRSPHFFHKDKFAVSVEEVAEKVDAEITKAEDPIFSIDTNYGNVQAAKKNAKIAGVISAITFSKVDPEWLDMKFGPKSISLVATHPPEPGRTLPEKRAVMIYDSFFNRVKSILQDEAKIACIISKPDLLRESAEKHGFKVVEELKVWQRKKELTMLLLHLS